MKTIRLYRFLACCFCLVMPFLLKAQTAIDFRGERMDVGRWAATHFARHGEHPFSFTYGGRASATFLKGWSYTVSRRMSPLSDVTNTVYTYTAPDRSLRVDCDVKLYRRQQAVMWTLRFTNIGQRPSQPIAQVKTTDLSLQNRGRQPFTMPRAAMPTPTTSRRARPCCRAMPGSRCGRWAAGRARATSRFSTSTPAVAKA